MPANNNITLNSIAETVSINIKEQFGIDISINDILDFVTVGQFKYTRNQMDLGKPKIFWNQFGAFEKRDIKNAIKIKTKELWEDDSLTEEIKKIKLKEYKDSLNPISNTKFYLKK
jgi:hypothetical protein